MNFFGIGLPEMAVIAAIGLLVFGPKRLPELGRTLGRTLKGFQSASKEFEQEFRNAVDTETVSASSLGAEPIAAEALAPAAAEPLAAAAEPLAAEPPVAAPATEPAAGSDAGQPEPSASSPTS
jgi:sec-independent protein translocase protein TatA